MKIPEQTLTSAIIFRDWVLAERMRRADENREMSNKLWWECSLAPARRIKFLGWNIVRESSRACFESSWKLVDVQWSLDSKMFSYRQNNFLSQPSSFHCCLWQFSRRILARETLWKASNRFNYSQESFYFENSVFHWRLRNFASDRETSFGGFVIHFDDCQK